MNTITPSRYVGIDLGAKRCQVSIIDADGNDLVNASVPSQIERIAAVMQHHAALPAPVAIEATFAWYWLADGLQDRNCDVHLVHAARCAAITTAKVKTDRRDAQTLAQLLRVGMLPEAYLYPRERRGLRDLARKRNAIVERHSGALRQLRCLLYREGHCDHNLEEAKDLDLADLPRYFPDPMVQYQAGAVIAELESLNAIRKSIEEELLTTVEEQPEHRLLRSIPGIGNILALVIATEINDIKRFRSSQGFCSYCRVAPGIAQSGASVRHGRANKAGNPHLKRSLHQAAVAACTHYPAWKSWKERMMARHTGQGSRLKATNAVAHRLARIIYRVLLDQHPYEEALARIPATSARPSAPMPN